MILLVGALSIASLWLKAPALFQEDPADRMVATFAKRHHIPGLAYVVLKNGNIAVRGQYGVADVKTKEAITATSVFPIASLSKPFVALGVLSLAEKRRISLSAPIGDYLTDLPPEWKAIPILRLLDHTSGVPDHYNCGKWDVLDPTPISPDEVYKRMTSLPLNFPFGAKFQYSNGNYVLLARLIEKIANQPYGDYLSEKIFKPLGMKNTRTLMMPDMPHVVQGYTVDGDKVAPARWNPEWCFGNGALGASSADLAKLDVGLYTERIVKSSTLRYITMPQPLNDGVEPNYAMGWFIGSRRGAKSVSHDGKIEGWRSEFVRFPDYNLTVIIVSNSGSSSLATLSSDLAGTAEPYLALDPILDANPSLTGAHRKFIEAIRDGKVDPASLSSTVRNDYVKKGNWDSLRRRFSGSGEVTLFAPVTRGMVGSELQTRYRLEQGDDVACITVGVDANGIITTLLIR